MSALRQEVYKALEEARASRRIGSSLEAKVTIQAPDQVANSILAMEDPEGFFIVSQLEVKATGTPSDEASEDDNALAGVEINVSRAEGGKCPRCWTWNPQIGSDEAYPAVCPRCAGVLRESGIAITES